VPFEQFQGELEHPEGIPEQYGFAEIMTRGDFWQDEFRSLRNLLLQLHSLRQVTLQLERVAPDIVIFARPDLRYHNSFGDGMKTMLALEKNKTICLPFWQWAGGYNDRFAICGKDVFSIYGRRIEQIAAYLEAYPKRPLHAERLLMFALESQKVKVRRLDVRATRVRVSGDEEQEDFSCVQANRLVRWAGRELCKTMI
jgi:hypothetical protein